MSRPIGFRQNSRRVQGQFSFMALLMTKPSLGGQYGFLEESGGGEWRAAGFGGGGI
jgi:hypothetical protein